MFSPVKGLLVRNWKQDVINLVHIPRTKSIPDVSPYGLKLETWLRINKLDYQVSIVIFINNFVSHINLFLF